MVTRDSKPRRGILSVWNRLNMMVLLTWNAPLGPLTSSKTFPYKRK